MLRWLRIFLFGGGVVLSQLRCAGLKKRFASLAIDFLVIVLWGLIVLVVSLFVYFVILGFVPDFSELGMNLVSLILIFPAILYFVITEAGKKHATFGKRKMKVHVASVNTGLHLWQIIVRNLIKFLPWQAAHMMIFHGIAFKWEFSSDLIILMGLAYILPCVYIVFICFKKDHRGIHDLIARTIVVET